MTRTFPIAAALLFAGALSACGGGGGAPGRSGHGDGNGATPAPTQPDAPATAPKNQLFAYDAGHGGVLAGFPSLALQPGTANTVNVLDTGAVPTGGLAYDGGRDLLYATTADGIAVYEKASRLQGRVAPARVLRIAAASASTVTALFYDRQRDVLYASGALGSAGVFMTFTGPASLSGTVTPLRTVVNLPQGPFTVDTTRNILYVRQQSLLGRTVYQFKGIDTLDGTVTPATFTALQFSAGGDVLAMAVDPVHDRLYYVAATEGVRFVDNASTSAGNPLTSPQFLQTTLLHVALTPNIPGAALAYSPANDRLYAGSGNLAYQFDGVSRIAAGTGATNALAASLPAGTEIGAIALP